MDPIIFMKGFAVGFFLCAPVGPIGILCARRTLMQSRIAGVVSVLGASTVDALYCSIAGLGIVWISSLLRQEKIWIQFLGASILVLLAIRIFVAGPRHKAPQTQVSGLFGSFSSTFLLTLANPMPILVFTAAFAAVGVHGWKGDYASTGVLVAGVFCGSAFWSPILALVVGLLRPQLTGRQMQIMNRVSGAMILILGLVLGFVSLL